jgi:dTDP-4-dehydrorhamnose reductase
MLNVGKTHDQVRVVNDQVGTPTYTLDLSRLLVDMLETEKYGYYHATNEGGYISWYDFTKEIYRQAGLDTEVLPVTTEEYGLSKAARPFNSRLDKSKLVEAGFRPLPTWQDAVEMMLAGASAVSVGTANFYNPHATIDIIEGMEAYLDRKGIASVMDIVGAVH